ncbi:MAG TPA: sugar transferase, partial [Roseiflexaceae bacterium]|nr:sugar transferase [Roseiflexaceae bacterium]
PIIDRPVMAATVELLARSNIKNIFVSLHDRVGPIASQFGSGKRWGVTFEYVTQREALGSAGALKWAPLQRDTTCIALPGNVIIDLDIDAAIAYHRAQGNIATFVVHTPFPHSQAPLLDCAGGRIVANTPDAPENALASTGAILFEPRALCVLPAHTRLDLIDDLLPALLAAGEQVGAYTMSGYWNPLDTAWGYQHAQQVYLYSAYGQRAPEQAARGPQERVRFPSFQSRQIVPGVWAGLNHSVHPSAKIAPPVYIGDNSWIGREAEVGYGAVIGENVVVDEEATVAGSTVLPGTYVGRLVNIDQRIVCGPTILDPATGDTTTVVDPFLLSFVGSEPSGPTRFQTTMNRVGALLLLVMFSPLFIIGWVAATAGSGMRPISRNVRVGKRVCTADGGYTLRRFELLQFRLRHDNGTYTWLGRWLERTELYRLPELISVARGDMALVGVKPLREAEVIQLAEEWHQTRFNVAPGFTGLWYQDTEPTSTLDAVLVADVYYVATHSWFGDLKLLLQTPSAWMRRQAIVRGHATEAETRAPVDSLGGM